MVRRRRGYGWLRVRILRRVIFVVSVVLWYSRNWQGGCKEEGQSGEREEGKGQGAGEVSFEVGGGARLARGEEGDDEVWGEQEGDRL